MTKGLVQVQLHFHLYNQHVQLLGVHQKARALAEKRSAKRLAKQNEMDLKLAEAVSLNNAQAEELANLRAALEACEEKWYNEGFADTENSAEPVMNQAWRLGFEAGWFVAL